MIKLIPIKDDCEKVYIVMNDIIIGKLNHYITQNIIKINYLLIYEEYRRFGFGKDVVLYLRNEYKNRIVVGDALPEAICFWKRLGAEFDEPFSSKIRNDVILTPFQII